MILPQPLYFILRVGGTSIIKQLVVLIVLFTSHVALALPINQLTKSTRIPTTFTANYDFEGIIKLSNCSGSLIRLEKSVDSDKALVMTNGHCFEMGFPPPNSYMYKQPTNRVFELYNAKAKIVGKLKATEIIYASMTKTDLMIYKLKETYAEIKNRFGVRPLTLASQRPAPNTFVEVISGYWNRGYSCGVEKIVNSVNEMGYTWKESIRYTRPGCEIIGGTSGSPVIQKGTRLVVGINNTINDDGEKCTRNNPCEIDLQGNIFFKKGYGYAQQTYWVYSCLNSKNEIDARLPNCRLLN